jgi:hypothetical protein
MKHFFFEETSVKAATLKTGEVMEGNMKLGCYENKF